jgi:hypothetical protein
MPVNQLHWIASFAILSSLIIPLAHGVDDECFRPDTRTCQAHEGYIYANDDGTKQAGPTAVPLTPEEQGNLGVHLVAVVTCEGKLPEMIDKVGELNKGIYASKTKCGKWTKALPFYNGGGGCGNAIPGNICPKKKE